MHLYQNRWRTGFENNDKKTRLYIVAMQHEDESEDKHMMLDHFFSILNNHAWTEMQQDKQINRK